MDERDGVVGGGDRDRVHVYYECNAENEINIYLSFCVTGEINVCSLGGK